jgi:hypothetical protein
MPARLVSPNRTNTRKSGHLFMKSVSAKRLYHYWQELRGQRPAPERRDIDPSAIKSLLSDVFILEHRGDEAFAYRLAGSALCNVYCRELKGRSFRQFWRQDDLEALDTMLLAIREDAAAAVIGYDGINTRGQKVALEMLLLPLRYAGAGYPRILGICTPVDEPYWLGVHPVMDHHISSMRLIWPDERPAFLRNAVNDPFFADDDLMAVDALEGSQSKTEEMSLFIAERRSGPRTSAADRRPLLDAPSKATLRRQAFRVIDGGRGEA